MLLLDAGSTLTRGHADLSTQSTCLLPAYWLLAVNSPDQHIMCRSDNDYMYDTIRL
eukprot:COSAG01_NODE_2106_length_8416_cov_47.839485_5_plen_56_part_00